MGRALVFLSAVLLVDFYAFEAFGIWPEQLSISRLLYWGLTILLYISMFSAFAIGRQNLPRWAMLYVPPIFLAFFLGKLVISALLLTGDIGRTGLYLINGATVFPERAAWLSQLAIVLGAIPTVLLLYGMVFNAYRYQVSKTELKIDGLPKDLHDLSIVQISDIHSGSLTRKSDVEAAIRRINQLKPDLIFFTGDLVNLVASEIEPWIPVFSKLNARYGVYSITGNHDYGDYVAWPNPETKRANFQQLLQHHRTMGWDVLMNEHRLLELGDAKLAILGVENWSANGRFAKYGDLAKAYEGSEVADLKLLLSHDPSHWRAEVQSKYPDISATFSGHTHAFQFGIQIGKWQWSPGQYVYPEWSGLYQDEQSSLYVNRGFGFTFYPGRVGMLPEISLFQLKPA
jgi:predicted MPP superfamily phosphohydrolase